MHCSAARLRRYSQSSPYLQITCLEILTVSFQDVLSFETCQCHG
ncbi:hypothetical protein FOMG_19968 [Fusarium oxysporum f. sp. melonis 26406]|uniref:Uncharacterized protein n=1 Tax=Fusarium oxysporum f. sp. melonis 26406 TaxID=1089452 RepID=W9Z3P5_FUSOX|nr:hypothetical protein FOMG_19968 [Fusarium oxysporum f. sp. melonis 26406]